MSLQRPGDPPVNPSPSWRSPGRSSPGHHGSRHQRGTTPTRAPDRPSTAQTSN